METSHLVRRGKIRARTRSFAPLDRRWRAVGGQALLLLIVAALALPVALAVNRPRPALAQKAAEWARFDVTLTLQADGTYHVVERQAIDFHGGPFKRGFRTIPMARIDALGRVKVGEESAAGFTPYRAVAPGSYNEAPDTYTANDYGTETSIRWAFPETTNATRTFRVEYDVAGALRVYPGAATTQTATPAAVVNCLDSSKGACATQTMEQIWWTAVGSQITDVAPVREASATIELPEAVALPQTFVNVGKPQDHTKDGRVWTWQASNLAKGDSLEVRLQFPAIVDAAPPRWQQADDAQRKRAEDRQRQGDTLNVVFLGLGLLLGVAGGLGVYGLWYGRGRDPHAGLVADFLPQPPDDLPPGAAGTLLDERADQQDVVATLVDLARRGVITMQESKTPGILGFGGSRDFDLALVKADAPLLDFERTLLRALFGSVAAGRTAKLSEAKTRFTTAQPQIKDELYAELVRRGYYTRSPEATRSTWRHGAVVGGIALVVLGGIAAATVADVAPLVWFPIIVVGLLAVALYIVSNAMPRRTPAGAEAAAKWRAFRKYLADVEHYEQLTEAKDIFDKYLPFAIAFGMEHSWVRKFAEVDTPAPAWYGGFGGLPLDVGPVGPYGRRRGVFGGPVIIAPGGWGGGASQGGGGDGGGLDLPGMPDLQGTSDRAGRSLQSTSDSLFDMLNSAASVFRGFTGGGGSGGGWGGGGGGWSGGGSSGGSSGGGGGGFS